MTLPSLHLFYIPLQFKSLYCSIYPDYLFILGLHVAAKYGAVDNCQFLIEVAGVHGNIEDNYKQTALFYSIESQAHSCSEYLLSIGCSPNHRNKDQRR